MESLLIKNFVIQLTVEVKSKTNNFLVLYLIFFFLVFRVTENLFRRFSSPQWVRWGGGDGSVKFVAVSGAFTSQILMRHRLSMMNYKNEEKMI